MKRSIFAVAGAAILAFSSAQAASTTFTLDFDTPASGASLLTTGTVSTPIGDVTLDCEGTCLSNGFGKLSHDQFGAGDSAWLTLNFDFAASSLTFDWDGDGSGVFTAQALDSMNNIVDSFFVGNTDNSPSGSATLSGLGIVAFRFADRPGGGSLATIDNLRITGSPIPVPAAAPLMLAGIAGLIARRRKEKASA